MTEKDVLVNKAVAAAADLPDLVNRLSAVDPALAQSFQAKALSASKSVYFPLVVGGITMLASHYALGYSSDFVQLAAGGLIVAACTATSAVVRVFTRSPIGGFFTSKK